MYKFTVSGNYLLVNYTDRTTINYQFPMIKTVYSFNGKMFKISEGEIMAENLIINVQDIQRGKVIDSNDAPFTLITFEAFLQQKTAVYK